MHFSDPTYEVEVLQEITLQEPTFDDGLGDISYPYREVVRRPGKYRFTWLHRHPLHLGVGPEKDEEAWLYDMFDGDGASLSTWRQYMESGAVRIPKLTAGLKR